MKKFFILLYLTMIITFSYSEDHDNSTKKSYEATVTASVGLIMRTEPTRSAQKIDLLPLGTLITVVDMDGPNEIINGKKANWFKIVYKNKTGWAFGYFISFGNHQKDIEKERKIINDVHNESFVLKNLTPAPITVNLENKTISKSSLNSECGGPWWLIYTLSFKKNNKVSYIHENTLDIEIKVEQKGNYTIQNNTIIISLEKGIKTTSSEDLDEKSPTTEPVEPMKIILYYYKEFDGFFEEGEIEEYLNTKIFHNKTEHYISTPEDEIRKRICFECSPIYVSELRGEFEYDGYYTIKK